MTLKNKLLTSVKNNIFPYSLGIITIVLLDVWFFQGFNADWVSAFASIGTMIIAYAAFKSAPSWLNDKGFENAHKIIDGTKNMITLAKQLNSINLILYAASNDATKDSEINNQLKFLDVFTIHKLSLEQLVESQNIWNVRIKNISKFKFMLVNIDEYLKISRFNTFNIKIKTSNLPTNELFHHAESFNNQLSLFNKVISSCQFIYDDFDSNFEII
ncbi:hypothetical protein ACHZKS_004036, partial [Yersinia enterocolitica]